MGKRDVRCLLVLLAALLVLFAPVLFTGRTYFLSDLTYFNHPWRELPAEQLQRGMLPLWNPYAYLGMPLSAIFQTGTFEPGNLLFLFFPFVIGYKLHLLFYRSLAAFFAFLWTRRFGGRWGAAAAAAAFTLGGFFAARMGLVIVTATLPWWPALFLFAGHPLLLGLTLSAALFASHPPTWAVMAAAALALPWIWERADVWRSYALGGILALALAACLLVPGAEMILHSNRSAGSSLEGRTIASLTVSDLPAALSPAFIRESDLSGAKYPLWACYYIGFAAFGLALLGLRRIGRRRALWACAFSAAAALILLGNENPFSLWLWAHFEPLRFIRFPGNFTFVFLGAALPLIAAGAGRGRRAAFACLLVCGELLYYDSGMQPTVPDSYFTDAGPLVRDLQAHLEGHRYALSPRAALLLRGKAPAGDIQALYYDVKHRLYASSNVPFHLQAATSLGESMLIGPSYEVMDFLFSLPSAVDAMRYLPEVDARYLLTKDPLAPLGPPAHDVLWDIYPTNNALRARWFPAAAGAGLKKDFPNATALGDGVAMDYERPREDRARVTGTAPAAGWLFLADPLYPGWKPYLNGKRIALSRALGAFESAPVAAGPFQLDLVYRPLSFYAGVWMSLAAFLSLMLWAGLSLRKQA